MSLRLAVFHKWSPAGHRELGQPRGLMRTVVDGAGRPLLTRFLANIYKHDLISPRHPKGGQEGPTPTVQSLQATCLGSHKT
jgi:hypothetical protein